MSRIGLTLLIAFALLAGAPMSVALPDAPVTEVAMYGCEMHYGVVGGSFQEASSMLPDGYSPARHYLLPQAPVFAAFFVLSQRCDQVVLEDGTVIQDYHDLLHGIFVVPPNDRNTPGAHAVLTGLMTPHADVAALYQDWGLPAELGNVTIQTAPPADLAPLVGTSVGRASSFGLAIAMSAEPVGPLGFSGAQFRLHVPDADGNVTHYAHYDIERGTWHAGAGTAAFTHGNPFTIYEGTSRMGFYTWGPHDLAQTFGLVPL